MTPRPQGVQVPAARIWPEDTERLSSNSEVGELPWVAGGSEPHPQLGGGSTHEWEGVEEPPECRDLFRCRVKVQGPLALLPIWGGGFHSPHECISISI